MTDKTPAGDDTPSFFERPVPCDPDVYPAFLSMYAALAIAVGVPLGWLACLLAQAVEDAVTR